MGELQKRIAEKFKVELPFAVARRQIFSENRAVDWNFIVSEILKIVEEMRQEIWKTFYRGTSLDTRKVLKKWLELEP